MKRKNTAYLDIGAAALEEERIVGIFDLDNTSWSYLTREFLSRAERDGKVKNTAEDLPRSFVLCSDETVILAQPTTATLARRLDYQERT